MDEKYLAPGCEDEIRSPRQVGAVKGVTVSDAVEHAPHGHFRAGVLLSHRRHDSRADLRREVVDHVRTVRGHSAWSNDKRVTQVISNPARMSRVRRRTFGPGVGVRLGRLYSGVGFGGNLADWRANKSGGRELPTGQPCERVISRGRLERGRMQKPSARQASSDEGVPQSGAGGDLKIEGAGEVSWGHDVVMVRARYSGPRRLGP